MAKKKILLAEDEPLVRLLVSTTIEFEDYLLLEAQDGEEALEIVAREHPDLILLDVSMPRKNGFDVCRTIKQNPATSDIHVVMLTAYGQAADRQLGAEAGADAYFTKPFSPLELLRTLREMLGT